MGSSAMTWAAYKKHRDRGEYDDYEREYDRSLSVVDKDAATQRRYQQYVQDMMASDYQDDIVRNQMMAPYLAEEERRRREEEEQRRRWQQEYLAPKTEKVQDGQSVSNFDTQAARRKAEPRIRYEQAYDTWNEQNPEYKDKSAEEKYSLFAQELDEQNKMADATQGYRDFYNRNKKDPEFQRMSDEEKRRQYMHSLDQTVADNGTLPEEQRAELSEYKYNGLSDKEKQVIDAFMRVEAEDFDNYKGGGQTQYVDPTGRGAYSQNRYNEAQQAADSRKAAREKTIEDVRAELKHLGWDDQKIDTELARYKELVDWNKTQESREKYEQIANDPNLNNFEKAMVGAGYTAADWISFIPSAVDTAYGYMTDNSAYGRNTSNKHNYMRRMAEEGTSQVRNNLIGEDHPIAQTAYDIGVSWGESMSTKLLGAALGGVGEELALLPFAISATDTAYRDAVNRGFSEKQAEGYSVAVGALEALTEKLPFDMWQDLIKDKKLGRSIITTALTQMGAEAGEEAVNEIGQLMADQISVKVGNTGKTQAQLDIENLMAQGMTQEEAQAEWGKKFAKQVGMAALSGAVSAAPDVAVGMGIRSYRSKYGNNLTQAISDRYKDLNVEGDTAYENKLREDKAKYENNPTQYIADNYKVNNEDDAKIKAGLEEIAQKEREGKKLSVSDKSFITENVLANKDQFNQEFLDNLYDTGEDSVVPYKYREVKTEVTEDQARQMLAEAAASGDAKAFIEAQRKTRNSTIDDVANRAEEIIDFYSGMAQEHGITKEDIGKALIAEKQAYMAGLRGEELNKDQMTLESQEAYNEGKIENLKNKTRTTIDTQDALKTDVTTKEGNTVKLDGVFTSDGIQTSDGVVSMDNLDLDENKATNKAYHFADNYESVNVKNNFINNIKDGQNIENYNKEYGKVYDSALAGLSLENVKKQAYVELDNDQIENIYETATVERQARAAESFAEAFNGTKGTGAGKAFNESSSTDPKMLKIASMMARATKYDIHLVDEVPQNKGARGAFLKSDNVVYVRADDFMRSLGHEFSHYIETYNKGEYASLRNAVANFAASKMGSDAFMGAVKNYGQLYKAGANQKLSTDDISGEMFNDIVPIILESKQGSKALAKYLAENYGAEEARTFGEKIKDVMDNIAGTIKKYLSNADHPTAYAKEMQKYADELGQFAGQFIKALDGAIQNYNKGNETEIPKVQSLTMTTKEFNDNLHEAHDMESLKDISFYTVKSDSNIQKELYDHLKNKTAKSPILGEVNISIGGLNKMLHHTHKDVKASLIDAIIPVIEKGKLVYADVNHDGGKFNTATIVAPVKFVNDGYDGIKAGTYYVGVSIERSPADNVRNQKLHVADVLTYRKGLNNASQSENGVNIDEKVPSLHTILEHVAEDVNIYPSDNKEIKFSLSEDSAGRELSEGQQEYFNDESPLLLDENGALKRYYHGTARKDRVGTVFRPDRATSGPMAFFTDDKGIAENYAKDKDDTSISRDERYDTYYTQFRLNIGGKDMSIGEAWSKLPASKRNEIMRKAEHVTWDDESENIVYDPKHKNGNGSFTQYLLRDHKGNYLEALVDSWLDSGDLFGEEETFLDILKMVGIENAEYLNPDAREEGVYEVYIHSTNPFDTSNISKKDLNALKKAAKSVTWNDADVQADMWDKNNVSPEKWISRLEDDIKNDTTHAWTSIPDWVATTLKDLGYDAISDLGGKGGGAGHQVVIPFESNQVKDINNENPSKDPDIRFSLSEADEEIQKAFTLNSDGRLILTNPQELTTDQWDVIRKEFNKLGYGLKNTKDAKDVYTGLAERGKNGYILNDDQDEALKKAFNITEQQANAEEEARAKEDAKKAEKLFGTTSRFKFAGYLDVNGKLLDFSKGQGYRVQDHREISSALDMAEDAGYSDGLIRFMNEGNIRMQEYGIDIAVKPNDAQRPILLRFFDSLDGEVSVDFSNTNGDTVGSAEYAEGTKSRKILADIDKFFDKGEIPEGNAEYRFSLSEDSEGNKLTKDQEKYFGESQIRNENGNLKVMYHGSNAGGFTIFDPKKSDDKISLFFTDSPDVADSYVNYYFGEKPKSMAKYKSDVPKITDIDTAISFLEENGYTNFTINDSGKYPKWSFNVPSFGGRRVYEWSQKDVIGEANSLRRGRKGLYRVYLDIQNPLVVDATEKVNGEVEDVALAKMGSDPLVVQGIRFTFTTPLGTNFIEVPIDKIDSFINETFGKDAEKVKKSVSDLMPKTSAFDVVHTGKVNAKYEIPGHWSNIRFNGGRANTRYIAGYAYENGYDGVYFKNIIDNGAASKSEKKVASNIAVAFNSDQVKAVDNLHPTDNPDIRYSISEDSEGRELTEGQQRYFNNTQALDEEGRLLELYHGTEAQAFSVFNTPGIWVTPDKKLATDYAGEWNNWRNETEGYGKINYETNGMEPEVYGDKYLRMYKVYANVTNPVNLGELNRTLPDDYAGMEMDNFGIKTEDQFDRLYNLVQEHLSDKIWQLTETKEFIDLMQELGYDGMFASENGHKTICVFNPNQIKNINNINPTSSDDIRYSLGQEDDWVDFDEMLGITKTEEKAIDILAKGMEALKNQDVDVPKLRTLALKIRNEFGSSYNANKLAEDLRKAFAYMQTEDHVDYPTMMGILRDIARPVIEEAGEKVGEQEYKDFIDYFKGKKIKLTSTQKQDVIHHFGSYGAFRNAMMPITISDNGDTTLDQIWEEMVQASGGMLDIDANEGDMPINLLDTLQAMRPYVRNDFGGDTEDLAKDLAMRIVEEYIEGESSKQMHKELTEYRNRLKKDYQERLKNLKGRANAEVLARNKRRAEQAKERAEVRDLKVKIKQNANKLYTWAAKPTEGKSVPHNMMMPVMQFLQAIDFVDPVVTVSEDGKYHIRLFDHMDYEDGHKKFIYKDLVGDTRADVLKQFNEAIGRGEGTKEQRSWTDKMQGIRDIYNKVLMDTDFEDTSMDFLMQSLDAQGLAEEFDDMLSRHKGQLDMNNLTAKELKLINNVITNIFHAVNQGNKAYSMNADIVNLAQDTIKESEGKKLKNRSKYSQMIHDFLRIDNATPVTFFELLGKGASKIYGALRNGLNQEILDIKKASEFMEGIMKEVDKKEVRKWTGKNATIHEFNLTNGSIKMTDAQIMGLYLTIRRTGGMDRIKGGIKVGDIKQNGKTINQDVIHLTDGDIKQIESVLTPEQISLAQKMQKYMAEDCSAQGNETSLKLYGYKKFTDPTYYPWTVDKDTVATTNTSENIPMFNSLERSGFTKQLKEGAKNPLVINDIFDVFTDHVSQMAGYHGYAASLKDTLRWMNYREMAPQDGGFVRYITNKNAINVLSGSKKGVQYIRDLMLDINKARKSDYIGNITEALMGNYKAAAVGANARVVIQQPTAYLRALNMIDPQYLMAVNPATAVKNIKKSQEECPISWWKSKGYYETNLGQPLKEIVTGIASPTEKAKDVMMAPAGYADDVTWGFLYTAVEKEQRAKFRGQNVSAEEYRKAVNARFDELVDTTQVVDSALHRSAYMRSKDKLNILQTAFMAEPTKTYNMIMKAVIEDAREGKTMKRTSRAAIAFLLTAIFNAAAQSLPDVWRHAGDDDDFWEKFKEYLQSNFTDNINPLNLLPIVKDIAPELINTLTGETTWNKSSSRFDIDALTTIFKDAGSLYKYFQGEGNKTGYGALMSFLRPVSQITGIPMYNLTRDVVGLYNAFADNIETTINSGTTRKNDKKKSFVTDVNKEKSEDTLDEGIVDALNSGVSIYDLKGAVKSEYKNKYFDAYAEGNMEEAQAIAERAARAYARMGMSDEDIDAEINEWQEETITYSKLDKAIADGEGIEEEIKHVQEGKEDDKIIKHIMDRYSETIAYEDTHETESDWRGNVEKALQAIDPTLTFDTAHEEAMQKAAEKAEKDAQSAEKKGYKEEFFASVDAKNGSAGRKALDGLKAMGVDAKGAKSMVSTQYHDAWKNAKTQAEKDKAKNDWKSAYALVCNYYGVEHKDLDKTWSDWEKDQ